MTLDIHHQAQEYSLSSPTAEFVHCDAVLELGRKLTQELGMDQSVDTLGRWMAHYIAELMNNVENANDEERPMRMEVCCDAILKLWQHRQVLSCDKRPFEELEPLMRTLKSLDPESDLARYFHRDQIDTRGTDEMSRWLKLIDGLDYSAKVLIRFCLTKAAENAIDGSREWLSLALAAGVDEDPEGSLLQVIFQEERMIDPSNLSDQEMKYCTDRIRRLESFAEIAMEVASVLRNDSEQTIAVKDN